VKRNSIISLLCAAALGLFLSLWLNSSVRTGGEWIPTEKPDEANRVNHEAGFSIVKPDDWTSRKNEDAIIMDPGCKGLRHHPQMTVTRSEDQRVIDKYAMAELGPYEAYREFNLQVGGGETPVLTCRYVVHVQEAWYRIDYRTPNGSWGNPQFETVPAEVEQYMETFRHSPRLSSR
jgi:hypothetical protein